MRNVINKIWSLALFSATELLWRWGRGIARACRWRLDGAVIPRGKRGLSPAIPVLIAFVTLVVASESAWAVAKTWRSGGGANATNWNRSQNWAPAGVPAVGDDVTIPTVPNNGTGFPVLNTSPTILSLAIQTGASVTGAAGQSLTVTGGVTGAGTLTGGASPIAVGGNMTVSTLTSTSTVTYNGAGAQTIGGGVHSYTDLTINKASGAATFASNAQVAGNLSVTAGSLDLVTFTANRTTAGGAITLGAGATLRIGGTNTFPANYTTATLGATSTVEYNGTTQNVANAVGASGYGHLILSGTLTKTALGAFTVRGDLSITGVTFAGTTFTHTVNGNVNNTGTHTATTGNITLSGGSAAHSLAGAGTYANLILNDANGATLGGSPTIGGTLTLTSGTFAVGANTLTLNGPTTAGTPANFSTTSSSSLIFGGASAGVIVPSGVTQLNNLTINNGNGITLSSSPTISGTLTLTSGVLSVAANTLTLNGPNSVVTGGSLSTTSSSNLFFGGSSVGVVVPSGVTQLNNLTINNSNGITLNSNPTINGTLTFTSGNLTTGAANTLTVAPAGGISGAATSRHVVGSLAKAFAVAGAFAYAVGDGTNYTPLAITFTTLSAPGNLTVTTPTPAGDHPDTTSVTSSVDPGKSVNRYWTLKNATLSGNYNATFNYISGTPVDLDSGVTASNFVIARGTSCTGSGVSRTCSTNWGRVSLGGAPTSTQATATGMLIASGAPMSDFVVGESLARFSRDKEFIYTRELY